MASDNRMYQNDNRFNVKPTQGSTPSMNQGVINGQTITQYNKVNSDSGKKQTSQSNNNNNNSNNNDSGDSYAAYLEMLQAQRRAAAEDAYNKAIGRINDAYNEAATSYANIYNSGANSLASSYNNSQNKINEQASDSMRDAYVNNRLSMKNLSQRLAAQGISGGASESATAGLLNNYGNSRNGIQKVWNSNLADLETNYNSNLADLYNAYQAQMASLANTRAAQINQAEANLANLLTDSSGSLYQALLSNPTALKTALSSATSKQANYEAPEVAEATNIFNPINTQQQTMNGGPNTNWEAWKQYLDGAGATDREKLNHLVNVLNIDPNEALRIANSAYQFG